MDYFEKLRKCLNFPIFCLVCIYVSNNVDRFADLVYFQENFSRETDLVCFQEEEN